MPDLRLKIMLHLPEVSTRSIYHDPSHYFKSNQAQAVRLPKAVAFPEDVKKVSVVVIGKSRLFTPSGKVSNHVAFFTS